MDDCEQRDIFKNHVATHKKHDDTLETLEWKEPGSSTYAMWFVRQYGTLMVWGDCYEATYQWSWQKGFSLRWISGINMDYFISKCRASPHGHKPYVWDTDTAEKSMREYFADRCKWCLGAIKDEEADPKTFTGWCDDCERHIKEEKLFEEHDGWRALTEDKFQWDMWLWNHAYDVFGNDWWESTPASAGEKLGPCIPLHLEGLKAAMAQLKEKNDAKIQSDAECAGTDTRGGESADGKSSSQVG